MVLDQIVHKSVRKTNINISDSIQVFIKHYYAAAGCTYPYSALLIDLGVSANRIITDNLFPVLVVYFNKCACTRWYAKKAWRLLYSDLSKSILTGSPYLVRISHPPVPSLACEEEVSTCPFRSRRNRCVMTRKQFLFGQTREQILNNLHEV